MPLSLVNSPTPLHKFTEPRKLKLKKQMPRKRERGKRGGIEEEDERGSCLERRVQRGFVIYLFIYFFLDFLGFTFSLLHKSGVGFEKEMEEIE